jgi:hypothetical protein
LVPNNQWQRQLLLLCLLTSVLIYTLGTGQKLTFLKVCDQLFSENTWASLEKREGEMGKANHPVQKAVCFDEQRYTKGLYHPLKKLKKFFIIHMFFQTLR